MKNPAERVPENLDGPFYVEEGMCTACLNPAHEAPKLMGFHWSAPGDGTTDHCYFKKQPVTEEEYKHAIAAMGSACCAALRYGGNDAGVLKMLADAVLDERCDANATN